MKLKVMLSVIACKLSRAAIRLLGRGGTDLPGRIALKLCPGLLGVLAKDVTAILVTGTNGKTTTSRMIEQALADSGISFFANRSGANLLSGVTAEFAVHATNTGRCRYPYALIEADEAAFKAISTFVNAKAVVVTNVFRDQLDRYGEVTHTLENIRIGLSHCKNAVVCLNADDPLTSSLAARIDGQVIFYGVDTPIYERRVEELSDAPYCIRCKHEYQYDYVTYGHMGGYRCPNCGYSRPAPEVSVKTVYSTDGEGSRILLRVGDAGCDAYVALPGGYNIYNACAAAACALALGLDPQAAAASLSTFTCGFGRMEKFEIGKASLRMILIKNPAGCNQVLNFLTNTAGPSVFVVLLNDRAQDGKDVSWIWDVDLEKVAGMGERLDKLLVSGTRADDMALRFKYAGVPESKLSVVRDHDELLRLCAEQDKPVYIMPTYTAMLDLRDRISKLYGFKEFWE